jgi:hypothetical protein
MSRNVLGPMSLIRLKRKSLRHKDEKKRIIIYILWLAEYNYMYTSTIESLFIHFYYSCVVTRFRKNPGLAGEEMVWN